MKLNRLHLSLLSLATVASLALFSCGGSTTPDNGKKQTPEDPKKENPDNNPNTGNLPALSVSIEGEINPTTFVSGQKGSVSFNRFPASVEEFKQVRNRIGKTPHGAAALNIMALEMYRRNANIGMQCLEIIGTKNYVAPKGALMNKLKGGVKKPYQYAAYLDGARYDNGYKPTKPYTIRVKVDEGRQYGKSSNDIIYLNLYIVNNGSDKDAIIKLTRHDEENMDPKNEYFLVYMSDAYFNVRDIKFDQTFEGLD